MSYEYARAFDRSYVFFTLLFTTGNSVQCKEYWRSIDPDRKMPKTTKDFVLVTDFMMRLRMGKRIHLCEFEADSLVDGLNGLFNREIAIPRIKYGKKQTIDTLISEEALLFAKYLRNEKKDWLPRIVNA